MSLLRIDHVQLAMPPGGDEQARSFYGDLLGLSEVPKPAALAARGGCWFEAGDVRVHLGVEDPFVAARKAHPAFEIDDLVTLLERLDAAGVPIQPAETLDGIARAHVDDPFGNRIELLGPATEG